MKPALGIFGGTFDPLHNGHLHLARTALAALPVDRLRWIPSGDPGHREAPAASGRHRLEMVRLAIAGEARFELDPAEIDSGRPTFTVRTLERLRAHYGGDQRLILVSGADSFLSLHTWLEWKRVLQLASIAVAARPGFQLDPDAMHPALREEYDRRSTGTAGLAQLAAGGIALFELAPFDVSASNLRNRLASGERPVDLLPPQVLAYIETNRLYRADDPAAAVHR